MTRPEARKLHEAARKKLKQHEAGKITLTFEQNCQAQRDVQNAARVLFAQV